MGAQRTGGSPEQRWLDALEGGVCLSAHLTFNIGYTISVDWSFSPVRINLAR